MVFICYSKCSTCQKAKKWLIDNNITFVERDIKTNNPNLDEIKKFHKMSGLDVNKLFNTSGLLYKNLNLKDKLKEMTIDEKYDLLASDGMLVKRPILIFDDKVFFGFKEDIINEYLK